MQTYFFYILLTILHQTLSSCTYENFVKEIKKEDININRYLTDEENNCD